MTDIEILKNKIDDFEKICNLKFIGGRINHERNPFNEIHRWFGRYDVLCVIRFWNSVREIDRLHTRYQSAIMRMIFDPSPDRLKPFFPRLEVINAMSDTEGVERDDWLKDVVHFILTHKKEKKIITLRAECWCCSQGYEFYKGANAIIEAVMLQLQSDDE
jgi:hypothetical protein